MANFQRLFNQYLFFGLFILAAMSFIIVIQGDNEAAQSFGADSKINLVYSNLTQSINSSENDSRSQYEIFMNEQPKAGAFSIVIFGIVAVGRTTGQIISNFFTIIIELPLVILQIPVSIFSILVIWTSISVVIALWLLYKFGGGGG